MTFDITKFFFIDNHAHSLSRGHLQLDHLGFRRCFSESRSMGILENHVPHQIHYMDLLYHLERRFDSKSEEQYLDFRTRQHSPAFINMLWDDVSIAALIIDDGYGAEDTMTLPELAGACERPVFHCRRIEPLIEDCILKSSTFEETLDLFSKRLCEESKTRLVALKTICGYRGGLSLLNPTQAEAKAEFEATRRVLQKKPRIERGNVYHYLLLQAFELAGQKGLPVQIHCGIGDDDANLKDCNPSLLQDLFRTRRYAATRFMLLHCFPFVKEAAFMTSMYANVFMDLSLATTLASPLSSAMITDALAVAPVSKLLAGSDGHTCPEMHWYGALSWKRGLTRALFNMINMEAITHREAESIAGRILHGNAIDLYKLEGLI